MRWQPAARNSSTWASLSWSSVETRAYPISLCGRGGGLRFTALAKVFFRVFRDQFVQIRNVPENVPLQACFMVEIKGRTGRNRARDDHRAVERREAAPAAYCGQNAAKSAISTQVEHTLPLNGNLDVEKWRAVASRRTFGGLQSSQSGRKVRRSWLKSGQKAWVSRRIHRSRKADRVICALKSIYHR